MLKKDLIKRLNNKTKLSSFNNTYLLLSKFLLYNIDFSNGSLKYINNTLHRKLLLDKLYNVIFNIYLYHAVYSSSIFFHILDNLTGDFYKVGSKYRFGHRYEKDKQDKYNCLETIIKDNILIEKTSLNYKNKPILKCNTLLLTVHNGINNINITDVGLKTWLDVSDKLQKVLRRFNIKKIGLERRAVSKEATVKGGCHLHLLILEQYRMRVL